MSVPEDSRIVGEVLDGDVNAYALLVKKYQNKSQKEVEEEKAKSVSTKRKKNKTKDKKYSSLEKMFAMFQITGTLQISCFS